MVYTKQKYENGDEKAPGMYFLREELDCENLGITVVDTDGEWEGIEHDHSEDGQEEVYLLVEGSGQITIDDDEVPLESGDAVRVAPGATRTVVFDEPSQMVIVGS